jgi:ribose/xylose/arabinose/galactoside ABC-type transport system permease subunit
VDVATAPHAGAERLRAWWRRPEIRDGVLDNLIWLIVAIAFVTFVITIPGFLSIDIFANVLLYSTFLGVMVIGETMCLMTGNFDLSVESVLAFTAMFAAVLMGTGAPTPGWGLSPLLVVPLMLLVGAGIGFVNGVSVAKFKINPFVVTLATMIIFRGLTIIFTRSQAVVALPGSYAAIATSYVGPISTLVIATAFLYLAFHLLITRTVFGRKLFAVGGSRNVAFAFGLNPDRVVILAFVLSGLLAGVAGWFLSARLDAALPKLAEGMTFEVFAAAVIGGISLSGGRGSLIGALGGVLLLGLINTALTVGLVDPLWFNVVRGTVIFVAVGLDTLKQHLR